MHKPVEADETCKAGILHCAGEEGPALGSSFGKVVIKQGEDMETPKVVAIIGSSRFKDQHLGAAQRETLAGHIVLQPGFYHHTDRFPLVGRQKKMLDELSFAKIRLADEVLVVNVNGYIGETTANLISAASAMGKPIRYLEGRS